MEGVSLEAHAQLLDLTLASRVVRLKPRDAKKLSPPTKTEKAELRERLQQDLRLADQCSPIQDGLTIEVYLDADPDSTS